jgi:hypothetical protein
MENGFCGRRRQAICCRKTLLEVWKTIMRKLAPMLVVSLVAVRGSTAPFQNLDFEAANTNNLVIDPDSLTFLRGIGTTTDLVPDWAVFDNTKRLFSIGYNFPIDYGPRVAEKDSGSLFVEGKYGLSFCFAKKP